MGSAYFWFIVWFFDKSWPLKPTNNVGWCISVFWEYLKMSLFIMLFLKVCFIFILTKTFKIHSFWSFLNSLFTSLVSMHISVQFYTYLSPVWCIFNCSFNAYFYAYFCRAFSYLCIFMHTSAHLSYSPLRPRTIGASIIMMNYSLMGISIIAMILFHSILYWLCVQTL